MIESILRLSIDRRHLILAFSIVIFTAGLWSYQHLPIDAVPDITNVQVQINTEAPGYSPLEVEQRISFSVENALAGIPNLHYTRSLSRYGLSQVTAVFDDGSDLYFARAQISERLANIKNKLPAGIETQMGPIASGLGEIYSYTVSANENARQENGLPYDAIALREIQDWIIKPQLIQVSGITEINTIGGYNKQYHVLPSPQKLLELSISFIDIHNAIIDGNSSHGAGYIERNGQQFLVRLPGQLQNISELENLVIKTIDNSPILLRDIAEVAIGKELRTGAASRDGRETVLGTAMMLIGENSRAVAKAVGDRLEEVKPSLPKGVVIETVYDRTLLVDKAISTVQKNLIEGAILVIVVLFLLLGNFRAALITAAVIPLAMFMTLVGMLQTGVSANLMSLGALDFGLIVDGAVIIVENTLRRLSQAQTLTQKGTPLDLRERLAIVYDATNEVIRPSLFGIAIITVVYIPLFSLSGIEGKMFHPMAATVVMALIAALVLSLTMVPAAVAIFMNKPINDKENRFIRVSKNLYLPALTHALNYKKTILSLSLLLIGFSALLAKQLGSEFIPQLKEGDIAMHAMRIPGTGLEQSLEMQLQLEETIKTFPEVDKVFSKIGTPEIATDPMPPHVADTFIMLKPLDLWPDTGKTQAQFVSEIEQILKQLPGNNYEFTQPIQMRFNELISGVRADLGIKIFGDDLELLLNSANDILIQLQKIEGNADAKVEQVQDLPVLTIRPKRIELARYGLNLSHVQAALSYALGGETSGQIYEGDRRFDISLRLKDDIRSDLNQLNRLPIQIDEGRFVPLNEIATLSFEPAPNQINRENGKRRIVVTANVRGRDLGSFVREAKGAIKSKVHLPAGYWLDYGGSFKQLESATKRLNIVIPITLAIIFALLLMAFSSFKDASIIFTGVPLALSGGVIALWLRDMPLSISAGVGFIALSGVAVLNGLVMLSFIRERYLEGALLQEAILEGALTRLRPVLMTALVASLGFIPMALNTGTGAEVQRPLATVVIGGIISSTLLTLFVLPLLYQLLHYKEFKNKGIL
ncbi:MAG: cobalt-zinc-cadmium resistance protein CzcA [Flavobacteriales bacterium]|jgi:cobalt-zinc-cadmium resistance protein CzcA